MAFPTPVNDQITDALSQGNVATIGQGPGVALGSLYQISAQAFGLMIENAVTAQQQSAIAAQAAAAQSIRAIYAAATAPETGMQH
jgi:hypothetical protein